MLKSTAPGGGPRTNPCMPCAFPSHTLAPGWDKGRGGGRGWDPRSSLKCQAPSGALKMHPSCFPCSALLYKRPQQGCTCLKSPGCYMAELGSRSGLNLNSLILVTAALWAPHPGLSRASPATSGSHSNTWTDGETEAQGRKVTCPGHRPDKALALPCALVSAPITPSATLGKLASMSFTGEMGIRLTTSQGSLEH